MSFKFYGLARLCADPEVKTIKSGDTDVVLVKLRLASDKGYGTKKHAVFIDATAWRKTAEIIAEHFKKGAQAMFEGEIDMDEWDDKETGKKRTKHTLEISNVSFVGSKQDKPLPGDGPAPKPDDDIPF